mgnify:CR=1 FL=1
MEAALSIYLENSSLSSREQLAKDSTDLVAKLRAYHNTSQTKKVNSCSVDDLSKCFLAALLMLFCSLGC